MLRLLLISFVLASSFCGESFAGKLSLNPYPESVSPAPIQGQVLAGPVDHSFVEASGYWSVSVGQALPDVLAGWSRREGVELISDLSGGPFIVPRSLKLSGTYEEAVMVLLEQYRGLDLRPVGQLFLPSSEHGKVLYLSLAQ